LLFFFFSSRRRHTRFSRDWSSDVCSSDLEQGGQEVPVELGQVDGPAGGGVGAVGPQFHLAVVVHPAVDRRLASLDRDVGDGVVRSEERRVGKECRSRWSADPSKKK